MILDWLIRPERIAQWARCDRARARRLGEVRHVVVIRPDEIGDVVLTSSFLRELRWSAAQATITLVVKPAVLNLVEKCPYVDHVVPLQGSPHGIFGALRLWNTARHIRGIRPVDLAIYPRWDADGYGGSLLACATGAPWRLGYSEQVAPWKSQSTPGFDRYFTDVIDDRTLKHEVEHNLDMLRHLRVIPESTTLEVWPSAQDEEWAISEWQRYGARHIAALGVGARFAAKQWPFDRYLELAARLEQKSGMRVALVGSRDDLALGEAPPGLIDWRGKTTLRQLAALLKRCTLFIGNDSGPLHIAAAAGIPVIGLSCHAKTAPDNVWPWATRFAPWSPQATVIRPDSPQPPCTAACQVNAPHCISGISIERILSAALKDR